MNNADSGINVQGWSSGSGNVIAFNAITPKTGTSVLRPSAPLGTISVNVTCQPATTCFVQPTTPPFDLWPVSSGPLIDAAGSGAEQWRPSDDFMGVIRSGAADVGAFERTQVSSSHLVGGGVSRPARVLDIPNAPSGLMVK